MYMVLLFRHCSGCGVGHNCHDARAYKVCAQQAWHPSHGSAIDNSRARVATQEVWVALGGVIRILAIGGLAIAGIQCVDADSARNRHQGRCGLGLAICHAIVRSHDGRIDAALSPLGGLHPHIELPVTAGVLQSSAALPP
jgi:hypothetical protein